MEMGVKFSYRLYYFVDLLDLQYFSLTRNVQNTLKTLFSFLMKFFESQLSNGRLDHIFKNFKIYKIVFILKLCKNSVNEYFETFETLKIL